MNPFNLSDKQMDILNRNISKTYIEKLGSYEASSDFINLIIQLKNKNAWKAFVLKEVECSNDEKKSVLKECNNRIEEISEILDPSFNLYKKYQLIDGSKTYYVLSQVIDYPKESYFWVNETYIPGINLYEELIDRNIKSIIGLLTFMRNQIH